LPFAGFENFEACVIAQERDGKTSEEARRICGALQAEAEGGRVDRLDFGRLGKVQRTPQGGIRVPAKLTRTGIFVYRKADGTERRELRPAEEVFHADSLATLAGAPVTDLHPVGMVGPQNWRKLSVGHVGEHVEQDGRFVSAKLAIQDATAIEAVDRGDRSELSCGYSCRTDETPGEFEGQRYDAIQRAIRYNHVALGPSGWGRAGNEVALRLDSKTGACQVWEDEPAASPPRRREEKTMAKIRIDGIEYEADSPALEQAIAKWDAKRDTEIATLTKERDEIQAKHDAANAELAKAREDLATATDPKTLDKLVADRVALHTDARKVLGSDVKLDGKTDRDVMIEAIKHDDQDFDADGRSDDYVRAYFEATTKTHKRHDEGGTGVGAVRSAAVASRKPADKRTDGEDVDRFDSRAARERMIQANREASTKPLRFSRDN